MASAASDRRSSALEAGPGPTLAAGTQGAACIFLFRMMAEHMPAVPCYAGRMSRAQGTACNPAIAPRLLGSSPCRSWGGGDGFPAMGIRFRAYLRWRRVSLVHRIHQRAKFPFGRSTEIGPAEP